MVRQKKIPVFMMFIFLSSTVVFGQGTKASEANRDGILKEQILSVYQSNGAEGVMNFIKNKTDQITSKFIIDLAKSGVKEGNREWLDISRIMAENRMDEETQVEVYYQIRKYIGRISGADKVFPFLKSANSRLSPAEECMVKGMVYFSFGDDQKALEMYEKALDFYKISGNPLGHWWLYLNMGDIYFFKGDHSTALSMYRTAVSIYEGTVKRVD
jgi:tetratricopeptide (TPR) repeat protein